MDFISDDGGARLGFDETDDVIANEEFSSWLNTQLPGVSQGPVPPPQPSPQARMSAAPLNSQHAPGPSSLPGSNMAMGQTRKQSPAPQISPKTQSGTPNPYNAWKTSANPPSAAGAARQSPLNGGPGFDGSLHGRTPSVAAEMSRYMAQMPSQRMMQQGPQAGPQPGLGMPPGMQNAPSQGPNGGGINGMDGMGIPREIPSRQGAPMGMPHGMPHGMNGPMGQTPNIPQGMQARSGSVASRMHPSMSPAPQHRASMMGSAGMPQGVPVPPGTPGGPQPTKVGPQGLQGPQGMPNAGPMGPMPPNQPHMYASPAMPGQMLNGNLQDGPMPYGPGMQPGHGQGSPAMGEAVMSPRMGPQMPPNMFGAGPQARMSVAGPSGPGPVGPGAANAAARRGKRRTTSMASNGGGPGVGPGTAQSPISVAQSPRPTPTPSANFSPGVMGPQMPQGPPHSRPMSRPGSRMGAQQSPKPQMAQSQFPTPQMQMQQHPGQPGSAGQVMMQGPNPMGRGAGPAPSVMPQQPMPGMQGPPPPGAPRTGSSTSLHVYSMPNEVVRLALISLSLYTQVHKFGPQSIAMKEIVRRIDSFPSLEQRRMVEKFEISRGGSVSELARLPISRVLPPIFWRTVAECYSQLGIAPIPQSVSLGANGPQVPLFPLFQAVQALGGYIDTTLTGRWPVVLRMLDLPPQGSLSPIEIIWVYATALLPFEVYASQHEIARRQLVSQLGPPRTSAVATGAATAPAGAALTPLQGQRPGTPGSGPNGPGLGVGEATGPMGAGADMRNQAQRSATAQRVRAPPTQQAPAISQTQVRAPQRRPPPGMTQPGMIPATQAAMQRDALAAQRAHMGVPGDQVGAFGPAGPGTAPPGAGPHIAGGDLAARAASVAGMPKPMMNGNVQGMTRGPYMDPAVSGPGGPMHNRRPQVPGGVAMPGPVPGPSMGQPNGPEAASSIANRHIPADMHAPMPPNSAVTAMQQRMLSDSIHAGTRPPTAGGIDANAAAKRAALADEEGRKRSRLGGPRLAEQLRRESQGKNTFGVLSEHGQYLLQRRHSSTHGGRNVRLLSALGNEIENWRPDVAFPLDLGIVDLHAVTRSLASQHPAEVRQTLDKLIVVSANPRVHESLQHCPRLLANLCKLVMNMIDQLLAPASKRKILHPAISSSEVEVVEDDTKLLARGSKGLVAMNDALQKYKRDAEGEVVIEVDSQTGAETGKRFSRGSVHESGTSAHHSESPSSKPSESAPRPSTTASAESGVEEPDRAQTEADEDKDKPFCFPSYGTRYQRVESEICTLEKPPEEMSGFLMTSLCDRLVLATCVLRNLSFSETNRPVIARKPEFLQLLWRVLEVLGTHEKLLDSELRTLDLCKDLLTVLGNVALYIQLPNSRDTLKLMLFLLSFAPVESPFTENGELKLMDYDIDVHRYLPNAIDVFAKIAPRENPNRRLVEEVLLGTSEDPGYKNLIGRWLKAQGRSELYPAELLSRMFALSIAMMPFTHFRPPSRDIDTRQPYLLQATMAAELLVNMIPDDEDDQGVNIALSWLESVEHFGARMVRTLNFMGMVVVNQPEVNGEYMRPFAKITQRGVNVVQRLFKKAKRSSEFNGSGIVPTIEHLLGGLMAAKMDKVVVKHLNALYDESTQLQKESEEPQTQPAAPAVKN